MGCHILSQVIPRRFRLGDPAASAYFDEHGYVVFRSVCSAPELQEAERLLWDFLEGSGLGIERGQAHASPTHLWCTYCGPHIADLLHAAAAAM